MNRNIAKPFTATLSLLDVASDKTHKYKCFHGEDIQLTVNVVGEGHRRIDLSNMSVKIYFTLDKNVNEPVYRQDTGIVVDDLGIITVMLEKSYIRIGNNVLKIVLYDEDQTVFLQPLIISCIDPLIGEVVDLEIPDDIDVRDELYDIRRIMGDLQDFDSMLTDKVTEFEPSLYNKKNTTLYNKFLNKLRTTNNPVTICCMGDSMTYGTDTTSSDKRPADSTATDNGSSHVATRASVTYPEALETELNKIYANSITVVNHGYSGDGTKKGYEHWNASGCDLCVINYGINDAINENVGYTGDIDEFIKWYRMIIDRELNNNTAVILITPPKQQLVSNNIKDGRVRVDVFSNAVRMLAKEYNCPVIDGNLIMEGYSSDYYSDSTHHNGLGYRTYACNLLGIFVGEGANNPYIVTGYDMLGANPLLDNFSLVGGANVISNVAYPSPGEFNGTSNGLSTGIWIKDGGSVTYSFYCVHPNMVVVPGLFTQSANCNVKIELDRGVDQAAPQNLFYNYNQNVIDHLVIEPSTVTVTNGDLVDYMNRIYTIKNFKKTSDPHLKILKRGWHTITVSTEFGNATDSCTFYGIEFLTYNDYLNKVVEVIPVVLENGVPYDESRTPVLEYRNGNVSLVGGIKDIVMNEGDNTKLLTFDKRYAPKTSKGFIVALSASHNLAGYAILSITANGVLYLNVTSIPTTTITTLYNCEWNIV